MEPVVCSCGVRKGGSGICNAWCEHCIMLLRTCQDCVTLQVQGYKPGLFVTCGQSARSGQRAGQQQAWGSKQLCPHPAAKHLPAASLPHLCPPTIKPMPTTMKHVPSTTESMLTLTNHMPATTKPMPTSTQSMPTTAQPMLTTKVDAK